MKAVIILIVVLTLSAGLYAKDSKTAANNFSKAAIENLKVGVHSDNDGLKRDCAYYAGKYQIEEMKDDLLDELKIEKSPSNKILIALALFYIGDEKGIMYIKEMSFNDENPKVRKMCAAIYQQYLNNLQVYYEDYAGIEDLN